MAASVDIIAILESFLSTDDSTRRQAQSWLETTDLQVVLLELLKGLESAPDVDARGLAAVLLKSRISSARKSEDGTPTAGSTSLGKYAAFVREEIAPRVLCRMAVETDRTVRNRLSSTVALIADFCFPEGEEWPDLWQLIGQWLARRTLENPNYTEDVTYRVAALSLLNRLAEMPTTLTLLEKHVQVFLQFLSQSFEPSALFEEKRAAFEVVAAIDQGISTSHLGVCLVAKALRKKTKQFQFVALKKMLRTFVPLMLSALENVIQNRLITRTGHGNEELRCLLNVIAEITDADPLFWVDWIKEMFVLMCRVLLEENLEFHLRQSALRIIARAASGCLRRASSPGSASPSSKVSIREKAEPIAETVCEIVQNLVSQTTSFVETDEEWMKHREDEPVDPDIEDILEALCSLMGEYLHDAGSPMADQRVLALALNLFASSSPVSSVIGLRLLSQLVIERPASVEPSAESILIEIITRLNPPDKVSMVADIRHRWWMLVVLRDLFGSFSPTLQLSRPAETLTCLATVACSDLVIRCKCCAMTALYAFLAPIEDGAALQLVGTLTEPFLKDIIVPAIQTNHEELQELGFALATVLAGITGESFTPYYKDCMIAVTQILKHGMELRNSGQIEEPKKEFYLCGAAIELSTKLILAAGPEKCSQDLPFLCEAFVNLMIILVKRDSEDTSLTLPTVLKGIGELAAVVRDDFAPFIPQYANCIFHILKQTDAALFSAHDVLRDAGSVTSELSFQEMAHGLLGRVVSGKVECKEEGGVTQLCVKGKDGDDRIIEFKTQIIDEKISALESLTNVLPAIGKHWIPYIPQTLELLKSEISSNYQIVRKAALEASSSLLSSLLPSDLEADTKRSESKCALATGAISIHDFFHIIVDLMTNLLTIMNRYKTPRAAEVVSTIEELAESLYEANFFFPIIKESNSSEFIQFVFQEFGKRMIVTMEEEIMNQCEDNEKKDENCDPHNKLNYDDWIDEGSSLDETKDYEDPEGVIYSGIMRSVGRLNKVFDSEECTQLFMTHLNTPFTGLLTLPEANMAGRSAALCIFAILLESGSPSIRRRIANEIIAVVLLYARCNDLPASLNQKIGTHLPNDDIYDIDVERLQAASYCLGVIATTAPQVFLDNIDVSITTLNQIINHPQAQSDERRPATECAVGALIKIFTSPELRQRVQSLDPNDELFNQIIQNWLPLKADEDESRTVANLLIDFVLNRRIPDLLEKSSTRTQLALYFANLHNVNIQNHDLVDKETWTSGKISLVQSQLS